jgi:glycosyltransferase involved in cell wall biosynthesis
MKVSVIVPVFNKRHYILRCLDSIARQTFRDWEAIVVDDGSTDGGGDVAASYPDGRFRLIRQVNAGPGAARNRALAEAGGEYVAFLDADDLWLPEYLETMVAALDRAGSSVAACTCGYLEHPGAICRERMWRRRGITEGVQKLGPELAPVKLHYMLSYMSSWSTVARTGKVRQWGGFFEQGRCLFGEDAVLWLKVLLNESVLFLLKPLVLHDRSASGLARSRTRPRPLEPFLRDAGVILAHCPAERLELVKGFLAVRAYKAAAMLGYWGRWREAASVFQRFARGRDWRLFYFWAGKAGCTPLAGWLGGCWRAAMPLLGR